MRRLVLIMLATLMALVSSVLAGNVYAQPEPVPAPAAAPTPAAAPATTPAPGQETAQKKDSLEVKKEIYYYQSEGLQRRDPFLSIITLKEKEEKSETVAPPLEKYDLSQMKLYAVVLSQKQQYAMVLLPDGKYYTVMMGDRIGIHDGYVSSMTLGTVSVIESLKNYKGQIIKREVLLRLRAEEGE